MFLTIGRPRKPTAITSFGYGFGLGRWTVKRSINLSFRTDDDARKPVSLDMTLTEAVELRDKLNTVIASYKERFKEE